MVRFLDIIVPGHPYRPHRPIIRPNLPDTAQLPDSSVHDTVIRKQGEVVDTILKTKKEVIDTLEQGKEKVLDTISSAHSTLMDTGDGGASSSTLLWSIIATLVALAFCFYLVHAYRHHMAQQKLEATPFK